MGVDKKIQMNEFNGTDYDSLYPKTTFDMVISDTSDNPTTLQEALDSSWGVGDIKYSVKSSLGDGWALCDGSGVNYNNASQRPLYSILQSTGAFVKVANKRYTGVCPVFMFHPGRTIFYKLSSDNHNYDIGLVTEDCTYTEATTTGFTASTGKLVGITMADDSTYVACFIKGSPGTKAYFYASTNLITWTQVGNVTLDSSIYDLGSYGFFTRDKVGYRLVYSLQDSGTDDYGYWGAEISTDYTLIGGVYQFTSANISYGVMYTGDVFIVYGNNKLLYTTPGSNTYKQISLYNFANRFCQIGNTTTYTSVPYVVGASSSSNSIVKLTFAADYSSVTSSSVAVSTIKSGLSYMVYCSADVTGTRIVQFADSSNNIWQAEIASTADMTVAANYTNWKQVSKSIPGSISASSSLGIVMGPNMEQYQANSSGTYMSASYIKATPNIQNDDYNAFIKIS